ncbi:hypothetical protein P5673_012162 [Acropora cervicornis]|uniref:Uncharacterized protein n=1 Tax=Acropora cervicornis TaxID=6130 RepID=A0AAD9QPD4_ACRCE|nr:hypothetical protein P5673_012162 [Acropora cervicornis]
MENLPAPSGPSEKPKDETVAGNCSDVLKALEKAFAKLISTSELQDLIDLHSRLHIVVSVEKFMELKDKFPLLDLPFLRHLAQSKEADESTSPTSQISVKFCFPVPFLCVSNTELCRKHYLLAAKMKGCEKLKDWVDPIINQFWYCCRVAEGSVEELKECFIMCAGNTLGLKPPVDMVHMLKKSVQERHWQNL